MLYVTHYNKLNFNAETTNIKIMSKYYDKTKLAT